MSQAAKRKGDLTVRPLSSGTWDDFETVMGSNG